MKLNPIKVEVLTYMKEPQLYISNINPIDPDLNLQSLCLLNFQLYLINNAYMKLDKDSNITYNLKVIDETRNNKEIIGTSQFIDQKQFVRSVLLGSKFIKDPNGVIDMIMSKSSEPKSQSDHPKHAINIMQEASKKESIIQNKEEEK